MSQKFSAKTVKSFHPSSSFLGRLEAEIRERLTDFYAILMRELTLCLLKPTLVKNPIALKCVEGLIAEHDFRFVRSRTLALSKHQAEEFYRSHRGKFFFDRLIAYICSGPVTVHVIAGEDAVTRWRQLMGPTSVYKAIYSHPDTIRGAFGLTDTRNATHGSDSAESAQEEIKFFFPDFSFLNWDQS